MQLRQNKVQYDLLLLLILIVIQLLFVVFGLTILPRVGVGFLFVAFIPGYVLLSSLLDSGRVIYISIRKLVLSVPLSLAISVLIGLIGILIYPKSMNNIIQVSAISGFDFLAIGFSFFRRRGSSLRGFTNLIIFISVLFILATMFPIISSLISDK
jgi:uncharacterized membrane protein